MPNSPVRWSSILFVALLGAGQSQGQAISPGYLVVTDLFGLTAANVSVIDAAGGSSSTFDLPCSPFDIAIGNAGEIFTSTGQTGTINRVALGPAPDCTAVGDIGVLSLGIALAANGMLIATDGAQLFAIDPTAFVPGDPAANRELVGSGGDLASAQGVAVHTDGSVFVATSNGPVVRVDPGAYDPGDPTANQTLVGMGAVAQASEIAIATNGELFVAEVEFAASRVVRYDPDSFNPMNPGANQLSIYDGGSISIPSAVVLDASGDLLVLDRVGVIRIDVASGTQSLATAGAFGVPFAKLAIAAPAAPAAVPALGATAAAILVALLCAAGLLGSRTR